VLGVVDQPRSDLATQPSADILDGVRSRLRAQVESALGERPSWRLSAEAGTVAGTICRNARAHEAELIVIGLGQHRRRCDRPAGDATALKVARRAEAPVLMVPASTDRLPANVVVCMDFSCASIRAARAAIQIIRTPAVVHLVYVQPEDRGFSGEPMQADAAYRAAVDALFETLDSAIQAPPGTSFRRAVLPVGDPAAMLLAYASANAADLIVAGTHSTAVDQCMTLGSVSTRLIKSAQCSVLVAGSLDRPTSSANDSCLADDIKEVAS
jgi:nucleotide-binding universal stress UspA family protein